MIAVFTNRGARLKSWRLKHFLDSQKQPQELIEHDLPTQPLPFTLRAPDDGLTAALNGALYAVVGGSAPSGSGPVDLRFEYRDSAGVSAIKEFHLEPSSYIVTFRATVAVGDRPITPAIVWGPAIGDVGEVSRYVAKAGGLLDQSGKVARLAPKDLATQSVYEGEFKYAGVDDNYFMTVALNTGPSKVRYQPVSIPPPDGSKDPPRELVAYELEPAQVGSPVHFFVGPKDFDVLTAVDPELALAINFGMFKVIVVPLLRSLKWVNGFAGNYGWSIILLTIIINVIMLPLKHKGVVSMRKMQEIQPEVKSIQDRYAKLKATDPAKQKMNQELMALYKERGVNPASGCVPMLLPMPVLLAMWALLFHVPVGAGRSRDLLRHDELAEHRAAVLHELLDGTDARTRDPATSRGAPRETRGRRKDRRCGFARAVTATSPMTLMTTNDPTRPIAEFLERFITAIGITATVNVEETADGPRLNLAGDDAELLVRHRGEPLKALQHVVDMAFGRTLDDRKRIFVDALEYRKGKDIELRKTAKFLAEKAKQSGMDQQLGPLNPYERRLVHLAVAEVPGVTTESVGDAFSKTVLISLRK